MEFLIAEFKTVSLSAPNDPMTELGKQIIDNYDHNPDKFTRSDVFELDMVILALQPTERTSSKGGQSANTIFRDSRRQINAILSPTPTPTSEQLFDPVVEPKARKILLADMQQLLYFIHWNIFFTPIRESLLLT